MSTTKVQISSAALSAPLQLAADHSNALAIVTECLIECQKFATVYPKPNIITQLPFSLASKMASKWF